MNLHIFINIFTKNANLQLLLVLFVLLIILCAISSFNFNRNLWIRWYSTYLKCCETNPGPWVYLKLLCFSVIFPTSYVSILIEMKRNKITCLKVHMICKRKSLNKSSDLLDFRDNVLHYESKLRNVFLNTVWLLKYIFFIDLLNYVNIINNHIHKYLFVRRNQYSLTKRSLCCCVMVPNIETKEEHFYLLMLLFFIVSYISASWVEYQFK